MELKPDWPKSFSRKGAAQHALTRYTVRACVRACVLHDLTMIGRSINHIIRSL